MTPRFCHWALVLLSLVFPAGCGQSDPLAESQRDPAPKSNAASSSPATGTAGVPAPRLLPPPLVDLTADQTSPAIAPDDLSQTIRSAIDRFAARDSAGAFGILVDPERAEADGVSVQVIVEKTPRIITVLLEGALRKALQTVPRMNDERTFALYELSDTTHLRFNKIDGKWRLAAGTRPNAATPGIGYDDAPKHAEFLLKKLTGASPVDGKTTWTEPEQAAVASLAEQGAGFAAGKSADGTIVTVAVMNRSFRGNDDSLEMLKSLPSLQIVAIYEAPITDAGLTVLPGLPRLTAFRLLRDGITSETIAAIGNVTQLRHLSLNALMRSAVSLPPLANLKSVEQLELINLAFDRSELADLKSLPELRRLDLSLSTVDDATLELVTAFPHLESVKFPTGETTADGVAVLRSKVPNLFLDW